MIILLYRNTNGNKNLYEMISPHTHTVYIQWIDGFIYTVNISCTGSALFSVFKHKRKFVEKILLYFVTYEEFVNSEFS